MKYALKISYKLIRFLQKWPLGPTSEKLGFASITSSYDLTFQLKMGFGLSLRK